MGNGIPILGTITKKCTVEKLNDFTFKIVLTQGLNRQIRRMCEYLNYRVTKLKRVRIMNIELDIPNGQHRELTVNELKDLEDFLDLGPINVVPTPKERNKNPNPITKIIPNLNKLIVTNI